MRCSTRSRYARGCAAGGRASRSPGNVSLGCRVIRPRWRTDGSPMGHPLHPPTRTGVVPLARRRRRHHDVRPRAVRPRRSVSHLSAWARAWGLPKRRRRLSSSRATFVVRQSESPDPAERFGFSFASRPGANRALTFPRHASPRQSSYKHVKHPRHPVCDVHLAKKRLRRSGPPPPRVRGVERRPGRRRRAGVF